MKAVFDVKPGSGYDDDITRRYHFPARSNYLDAARNAIGDWVLYREPQRNGGRRAYIATARVVSVEPDPDLAGHYYAYVADYLEFTAPVPFVANGRYAEAPLRTITDPNRIGQALQGKSMRPILTEDFDAIVLAGLSETLAPTNAVRLGLDFPLTDLPPLPDQPGVAESIDRRIEQMLVNRKIRDANFRLEVCRAYEDRCAVTGLKIINGGGRAEVQAAHIRPVEFGGPDVVQNGIALSATVHWLFDRHLISIDEDYRLDAPGSFMMLASDLFRAMDEGGDSVALRTAVKRFNGAFYKDRRSFPLAREAIGSLIEAAKADWKEVEPAIFGALLEQALSVADRSRLGAHYTPRPYVERLVTATVIDPLRQDWKAVQGAVDQAREEGDLTGARAAVAAFHTQLTHTRVLDPACGTGNFLYVTLELMKALEAEVLDALTSLEAEAGVRGELVRRDVDPSQFFGLELNPRAAAITELVLWIGYLQTIYRQGDVAGRDPVLEDFRTINPAASRRKPTDPYVDAILLHDGPIVGGGGTEYPNARLPPWPEAEFIVGNPPFIGGGDIREEQGGEYVEALRVAHPTIKGSADLVMYWWDRAADILTRKGSKLRRFGLVTTNSITQVFQYRVIAKWMAAKRPLSIVFAVADHPWTEATSDAAAAYLAILSSVLHVEWTLRSGGTLEDRPRYTKTRCFDPFPFPEMTHAQHSALAEAGERLDAFRKARLIEYPRLTMTRLYNALEAHRAELVTGEKMPPKVAADFEIGSVLALDELHLAIDRLALNAYGWPQGETTEQRLARLVALNATRATEEARGQIRWLRPEYQWALFARDQVVGPEQVRDLVGEAPISAGGRTPFPPDRTRQHLAVMATLAAASGPLSAAQIAARYTGRNVAMRVDGALKALARLGYADPTDEGRAFTLKRAA